MNLKELAFKIKPMLAFAAEPFDSPDFIFELKLDGTRCLVYFLWGKITLINRRLIDITYRYPEFSAIKDRLNAKEAILDGEIVVFKNGKPNFSSLQEREHVEDPLRIEILSRQIPATYVAFDILHKDGKDLTSLPLIERKKILSDTVIESEQIILSDFVDSFGIKYFENAKRLGLEGIIAKKKDSVYEIGKRSKSWLKIKATKTFDCVICGMTKGKGLRKEVFGALVLGMFHGESLVYVGRVGTGWSERQIKGLHTMLSKYPGKKLFEIEPGVEVTWVKPKFVCEIEAMQMTKDRKLRAPSFKRIREDKEPEECKLEDYL